MENNYWLVIGTLLEAATSGPNRKHIAEARLKLATAFDRAVVCNLPSGEITKLLGVLDELSDKIEEQ
jgi:hypothetical protein